MPKDSKVISAAYGRSERFRTLKKLSKVGFRSSVKLEQQLVNLKISFELANSLIIYENYVYHRIFEKSEKKS